MKANAKSKKLGLFFVLLSAIMLFCSCSADDYEDTIKNEGISYTAIVLDEPSGQLLNEFAFEQMPWEDNTIYCHHSTIAHYTKLTDDVLRWVKQHQNEEVELTVEAVGHSDKAFAVRVSCDGVPCTNAIRHITLATNNKMGGTAVDSNYIEDWVNLEKTFKVKGRVSIIYFNN